MYYVFLVRQAGGCGVVCDSMPAPKPPIPRKQLQSTRRRSTGLNRAKLVAEAKEEGAAKAFEVFVEPVVEMIQRTQDVGLRVVEAIDACLETGHTTGLRELTPLYNSILKENARVLDRVFGSAVKREESRVESTHTEVKAVVHVTLGELLGRTSPAAPIEGRVASDAGS